MPKSHNDFNQQTDEFAFSTVVYVTDQYACETLIAEGRKIADRTVTNLYVVNVSSGDTTTRPIDLNALEYLYQTSRKHHAVMNVFYETEILEILKKTAIDYNASHIVIGAPRQPTTVLNEFLGANENCTFYMVHPNGNSMEVTIEDLASLRKNEKVSSSKKAR